MAAERIRLTDYSFSGRPLLRADLIFIGEVPYIPTRHAEMDGAFYLTRANKHYLRDIYGTLSSEPFGTIYVPPHSSMSAEDVMGAHYAWEHEGAWMFAHCSPDEQVDFAADARTFALEQFTLDIEEAFTKALESTNAVVRNQLIAEIKALVKFKRAVGSHVYDTVIGETLGHYHRDEHHDHRRELAIAGMNAVVAKWAEAGKTDLGVKEELRDIVSEVNAIRVALQTTHTIETRAARKARLEAEKKAAEAEAASETAGDAQPEGA